MRFVRSYKRRGGLVVTVGIPLSSRAHRSSIPLYTWQQRQWASQAAIGRRTLPPPPPTRPLQPHPLHLPPPAPPRRRVPVGTNVECRRRRRRRCSSGFYILYFFLSSRKETLSPNYAPVVTQRWRGAGWSALLSPEKPTASRRRSLWRERDSRLTPLLAAIRPTTSFSFYTLLITLRRRYVVC